MTTVQGRHTATGQLPTYLRKTAWLVTQGCDNAEIAASLTVTVPTVENYLSTLYNLYELSGAVGGNSGSRRIKLAQAIETDMTVCQLFGEMF